MRFRLRLRQPRDQPLRQIVQDRRLVARLPRVVAELRESRLVRQPDLSVAARDLKPQAEIARLESGKLDSSFGIRLQMWHVALHLLAQDPLFGAGTGQEKRGAAAAEFMIEKNYDPSLFTTFDHLHSEYFDTLASYGLAGLGALLALLAGAVWRVPLPGRIPLVMVLAIVSIEALTETVFVDTKLTLGFVFLITALRARANNELAGTARTRFAYPPLPIPKNGL